MTAIAAGAVGLFDDDASSAELRETSLEEEDAASAGRLGGMEAARIES